LRTNYDLAGVWSSGFGWAYGGDCIFIGYVFLPLKIWLRLDSSVGDIFLSHLLASVGNRIEPAYCPLFSILSLHTKRRDQSASFDMDISTMTMRENSNRIQHLWRHTSSEAD
jgi:hypothetical protein